MPVIATNTAANSAVRYLNKNADSQSSSLSKLASGSRISQASDDAAGLAISTRLSSDVATLNQASTNSTNAIAVLQTADGGASNISDILQRMKVLATESASGTVTDTERSYIDEEFSSLTSQIDTIASGTRFNSQSLLTSNNMFSSGVSVMVGSSSTDTINIKLTGLDATTLGVKTLDVTSQSNANTALTALDSAIDTVSNARASIGAQESQFQFSSDSISTQVENLESAKSSISDVDVASEEAKLASSQVMVQAAVAAASSANSLTQNLLKLMQ
ncbi:flagellin [Pleomorphomonas sp. PLEO]|uniref:flagellin n=1 Tax=Pleomorphomonas sp. PLEO TaxID=3239306 RepID=UPI00351E22F7